MNKREQRIYTLTMIACIQFVILTLTAMFFYSGGTLANPTHSGYAFFSNFFSDLGMIESHSGAVNTTASALFTTALTLAGIGLVLFFTTFPHFFAQTRSGQVVSLLGSTFGVICGLSFIGIAFTPADKFIDAHTRFVYDAFTTFLVVVIFYSIAIFLHKTYPNVYAGVLLVFAVLLAGYLWLLFFGPDVQSEAGLLIQVTGQKVIAYAAIIALLIVSYGARQQTILAGE
ncbi:MAG: hypothetical protein H6662_08240 [Ardenticatenaceae bacterium]|nr:hypothetical protein [Anaerolineales bacterium]MCB8921555.1 hypothetical protein [Ardenticatenaceae bacterium]MCB8991472.1 hypothetical protein [Ardenticatenaceae bacterium]MCB9003908.1 hypothetical protein [Ardenticatenaceae bacterium]